MMSVIAREFFEKSPVLVMPLIGLCIFGTTFLFVVWQVFRRNKEELNSLASLPFMEGASSLEKKNEIVFPNQPSKGVQ